MEKISITSLKREIFRLRAERRKYDNLYVSLIFERNELIDKYYHSCSPVPSNIEKRNDLLFEQEIKCLANANQIQYLINSLELLIQKIRKDNYHT